MASSSPYSRLHLYTSGQESYILAPVEQGSSRSLTINRISGEITLGAPGAAIPVKAELVRTDVYGVIGLVSLALSEYLILLTGRELRGQLMGHNVYRATDFTVLPLNPDQRIEQQPLESHLLSLVRHHLSTGHFWFSYGWDLTTRFQTQWRTRDSHGPLWATTDDRFFWNRHLQSRLIDITLTNPQQNLSPYILPILFGTFDIRPAKLNGRDMLLCLISRRSRYRAGTRYFKRGIDKDGHVANFNETEQIVLLEQLGKNTAEILSFVQIRGSIPLYWAEVNTLRYKPDLQIMELQDSVDAMKKHLQEQVDLYGKQTMVNLVNHKGYEKPIKEAFEKYVTEVQLPNNRYEYFDFHTECKNMRWDRISVLIARMDEDLNDHGYFHWDPTRNEPYKLQNGVVRTNCMDNLDRTNVAQAAFAKWTLNKQLREAGVLEEHDSVDSYESFMHDFRNMWADHADMISTAYSGTGALKTDFTRTGKRTKAGLLQDGVNSVMRYMKNNYFDGPRQDAFDIFTGSWIPGKDGMSLAYALHDHRPLVIRSMPFVAWYSVFMICAGLTLPRTSGYSLFYYFLIWIVILSLAVVFILAHGVDYVAWPRLNPLSAVLYYDGPGFRSGRHGRGLSTSQAIGKLLGDKAGVADWASSRRKRAFSRVSEIELGAKKRAD